MKFKVGDKVRAIESYCYNDSIVGKIGTVIEIGSLTDTPLVEFDEVIAPGLIHGRYAPKGKTVKDYYRWYTSPRCLELVKSEVANEI